MNKSLIAIFAASALTFASFSATAADDEPYTFIGFGLTHYDDLANLELSHVDIDLVPELFVGFGQTYQLNQDWQLSTEISLHYSKAHFSGFTQSDDFSEQQDFSGSYVSGSYVAGNYEALGLWATSRFNYMSLSENVTPFIEFGVGAVETNHGTLFGEEKNHGIAYKAVTGLEFSVANDMTFSIGLGISDNDNNL